MLTFILAQTLVGPGVKTTQVTGFDGIRLGGLLLVTGFGFLLTFYVIYPSLLKQSRRLMPLTLYGRCLGGWLFIIQVLLLVLFWREFVWGDPTVQINTIWPKAVWVVWIVVSSLLSGAYFRTSRRQIAG